MCRAGHSTQQVVPPLMVRRHGTHSGQQSHCSLWSSLSSLSQCCSQSFHHSSWLMVSSFFVKHLRALAQSMSFHNPSFKLSLMNINASNVFGVMDPLLSASTTLQTLNSCSTMSLVPTTKLRSMCCVSSLSVSLAFSSSSSTSWRTFFREELGERTSSGKQFQLIHTSFGNCNLTA